jgi:hypothetical protein
MGDVSIRASSGDGVCAGNPIVDMIRPQYAQTSISAPGIRSDRCGGSNQGTSGGDGFYPSELSGAHRIERREHDAVAVSQATWPAGCKLCGESRTEETPPEDVRRSSEEDQRGSEEAVGGSKGEGVTTHPRRRRP